MKGQQQRYEPSSRPKVPRGRATERPAPAAETSQTALIHLQRAAGNTAVGRLLQGRSAVQRQVDEAKAKERVTDSEFKDLRKRLEVSGGTGMGTLYTGQFIRLASLFRKNRDSLNMLKSDTLEHLAVSPYETQDTFVATDLHDEVERFSPANQNKLIDNAVSMSDMLASLASLSVQSMKHIAVPKHAWDLVVDSPATFQPSDEAADARLHEPSWQQVAAVMGAAIARGRQTLYKATFQRLLNVSGREVAVTFAVVGGKPRVSDAWVVTR